MKIHHVPIADIIRNRELEVGDDLSDLEKSIQELDLKMPVLLDEDKNLIDGLRRLAVFEAQGRTIISAVVSDNYETSCAHIEKVRLHGVAAKEVGPRRIWEFLRSLHEQMMERSTRLRTRSITQRQQQGNAEPARNVLARAFGHTSSSLVSQVSSLYRTAEQDTQLGQFARQQVALLEAGAITASAATDRVAREERKREHHISEAEQRLTLEGIATAARSMTAAIRRVGELHLGLGVDQIATWEQELRALTTQMRGLTSRMRKAREGRTG